MFRTRIGGNCETELSMNDWTERSGWCDATRYAACGNAAGTALMLAGAVILGLLRCLPATEAQADGPPATKPARFTAFGTWNGMPVMLSLVQQYENDHEAHFIDFTPLDSEEIPGDLAAHKCDVGITLDSRLPEKSGKEAGRFENHALCRFVVAVAVNTSTKGDRSAPSLRLILADVRYCSLEAIKRAATVSMSK